jgi:hypothetical protein
MVASSDHDASPAVDEATAWHAAGEEKQQQQQQQ